jgi:hypothetical protein
LEKVEQPMEKEMWSKVPSEWHRIDCVKREAKLMVNSKECWEMGWNTK